MDQQKNHPADSTRTGEYDTGEFGTGEFDRTGAGDRTVSGNRTSTRRRRRRRSKKRKKLGPMLTMVGLGLFCLILVGVGILVGLSYSEDKGDAQRYQQALQARKAARDEWLTECAGRGYSDWTCNRFDRVHFEKAKKLDEFGCTETGGESLHQCHYKLGTAEVLVSLPEPYEVNGQFLAPRERPYAVVGHSNAKDRNYISVSENGHIEIRTHESVTPLFIINPATGSLNALHADVQPDQ